MLSTGETFQSIIERGTGSSGSAELESRHRPAASDSRKRGSKAEDSLNVGEEYKLIFEHINPPAVLSSRFEHACNRRFNTRWLNKYAWLHYSPTVDGVYCGPRTILLSAQNRYRKGSLVNAPFTGSWTKISDSVASHAKLRYHSDSVAAAGVLRETILRRAGRIDAKANTQLREWQSRNAQILKQIIRVVNFLARKDSKQVSLTL